MKMFFFGGGLFRFRFPMTATVYSRMHARPCCVIVFVGDIYVLRCSAKHQRKSRRPVFVRYPREEWEHLLGLTWLGFG